jgi:phosphate transport system substrate-binding protein
VNLTDFGNDAYPITRRIFVVIKRDGKLDEQAGVAYVNMLLSDEGQQLVEQAGLVPLRTR